MVITTLFFTSCEEVIKVDLDTSSPKLVIEAAINWEKGTTGNEQKIKLTTTTDFYTHKVPVVSNATVFITNSVNIIFNFTENLNTGEYVCKNFVPVLNEQYSLTVISNGTTYTATESLKPVANIINVVQNNTGGITGKDLSVNVNYIDPVNEKNFYLYKYKYSNQIKPDLYVDEDVFFNGNPFFSNSFNNKLKVGDIINITHTGISKSYYNYLSVLLSVAGNSNGGPFQTPPVTIRGNIINNTNQDNFPFGYFSLSETESKMFTIQ